MPDFDSIPLKSAELATLLDLTVRRIQQLAREGVFERDATGKFPLGTSVRAYLKVRADPQEAEWRRRHERARALLSEHKLRKIEADYADPLGLWPTWCEVWFKFSKRLIATVENTLPPRLVKLTDPYRAQQIVGDAVRAELTLAADEIVAATRPGLKDAVARNSVEAVRARIRDVDTRFGWGQLTGNDSVLGVARRGNGKDAPQ